MEFPKGQAIAIREVDAAAKSVAGGLPIYWGTGAAIERPHVVAIFRNFALDVIVYPQGDTYESPRTWHTWQVDYTK